MRFCVAMMCCVACGPKLGAPDVAYGVPEPIPMVHTNADSNRWYVVVDTGSLGERVFFLDSGYARTTCDDDFVAELGLNRAGVVFVSGVGGSMIADKARLPTFDAGGHTLSEFACIVRDLNTTSSIKDPRGVKVAGVIGADLLSQFVTTIDPVSAEVLLEEPSQTSPLSASTGVIQLRRAGVGGARFLLRASIENHAGWWLLDTGARGSHVDGRKYDIEPTSSKEGAWIQGTGSQGGQRQDLYFFDEATVVLAGHPVGGLRLVERKHGPFGFDLLGLNVVSHYRITLDPVRGQAWFEPVGPRELPLIE